VQEGCFSAVVLAIGRLEGKEEVVRGEVEIELVEDNLLEELGKEREIGDRAVVFEVVGIKVVFLEERTDYGGLENVRDGASLYGSVDDVSNEGQKLGNAIRVERGREGVQFTGFKRHGLYGFENFILRDRAER
jgi:hypothetical protein